MQQHIHGNMMYTFNTRNVCHRDLTERTQSFVAYYVS